MAYDVSYIGSGYELGNTNAEYGAVEFVPGFSDRIVAFWGSSNSGADRQLQAFDIDKQTGVFTPLGSPVSLPPNNAVSNTRPLISFSDSDTFTVVWGSNGSFRVFAGVFNIDSGGAITQVGSTYSPSGTGVAAGGSFLKIDDEHFVLSAVHGDLLAFSVDLDTGAGALIGSPFQYDAGAVTDPYIFPLSPQEMLILYELDDDIYGVVVGINLSTYAFTLLSGPTLVAAAANPNNFFRYPTGVIVSAGGGETIVSVVYSDIFDGDMEQTTLSVDESTWAITVVSASSVIKPSPPVGNNSFNLLAPDFGNLGNSYYLLPFRDQGDFSAAVLRYSDDDDSFEVARYGKRFTTEFNPGAVRAIDGGDGYFVGYYDETSGGTGSWIFLMRVSLPGEVGGNFLALM